MHTSRKAKFSLTPEEVQFMYNQPDNHFNKAAPYLALYRGAWMLITDNLNVKCGLGQGIRVHVVDWAFPDGTTFETMTFKNCRARRPSAPPLFVLVELTSTILKATPPGQPPNLPPNVVALPMYKHKKAHVDVQRGPNSTRHSVTVQLTQLPLRPANALTTYAAQATQFPAFVIHETNRNEFYTQVSRAKYGVETISITTPSTLPEGFTSTAREDTDIELERLRAQHARTAAVFEQELRQLPNPYISTSYLHLHESRTAPANIAHTAQIISITSFVMPLNLPICIIYILLTPIYPLAVSFSPLH